MFPLGRALEFMKVNFPLAHELFGKRIDLETCTSVSLLNSLGEFLLIDAIAVCASFRPILLDLVSRCLAGLSSSSDVEKAVALMLPVALRLGPACLLNVVLERLRELSPLSPFDCVNDLSVAELRMLVHSVHDLLSISIRFASLWSWSPLLWLVNRHPDEQVRFFAGAAYALYLRMSDSERRHFAPLNADAKLRLELLKPSEVENVASFEWDLTLGAPVAGDARLVMTHADLFDHVVSVCGILLPKHRETVASSASSKLVYTNSAVRNLQAIAIALARGRPVVVAVNGRERK